MRNVSIRLDVSKKVYCCDLSVPSPPSQLLGFLSTESMPAVKGPSAAAAAATNVMVNTEPLEVLEKGESKL